MVHIRVRLKSDLAPVGSRRYCSLTRQLLFLSWPQSPVKGLDEHLQAITGWVGLIRMLLSPSSSGLRRVIDGLPRVDRPQAQRLRRLRMISPDLRPRRRPGRPRLLSHVRFSRLRHIPTHEFRTQPRTVGDIESWLFRHVRDSVPTGRTTLAPAARSEFFRGWPWIVFKKAQALDGPSQRRWPMALMCLPDGTPTIRHRQMRRWELSIGWARRQTQHPAHPFHVFLSLCDVYRRRLLVFDWWFGPRWSGPRWFGPRWLRSRAGTRAHIYALGPFGMKSPIRLQMLRLACRAYVSEAPLSWSVSVGNAVRISHPVHVRPILKQEIP